MCESNGMRMTADHAGSGAFAAVTPGTKTVVFSSKRLNREWGDHGGDDQNPLPRSSRGGGGLCAKCRQLLDYARVRLERCRFGAEKPTCAKCPVHCYQRARREQVKVVMRYAGPRMLWEHPVMSLRHWLDGFRSAPAV